MSALSFCLSVIKLFLKSGNAKRVLFLVDRLELEDQAYTNFVRYLKNDFTCVIYKENRDDWRQAEIVVSTIQTLGTNNHFKKAFSCTDFDLVISDEAHRSIGGNSRAVFDYFVGYKLGLTATPKDYLKKVDAEKLSEKDPRELERRQLLDTYVTFGCSSGIPTYRYSLSDGVQEGFLVQPTVADARTDVTTKLLKEEGYVLTVEDEEGNTQEKSFYQRDFEKKFFSEETNKVFCKTFLENALHDPLSGEIGKSIVFCVSQAHASKITQILNEFADLLFPGKYQSDFAVQITSNIPAAQQMTINFANNNLNGHTNFVEGYITSKTRVCVTVGMMTTGYDCTDILNVCLMRPVFSPTDFIQIKGRGTRKHWFIYKTKVAGTMEEVRSEKQTFKLFDFFANCEFFEEKYDYDQILNLPQRSDKGGEYPTPSTPAVLIQEASIITADPLKTYTETQIGLAGMRIDRELFQRFGEVVKSDSFIQEKYDEGNLETLEEYVKTELLDQPDQPYTLETLRRAVKADRNISLREMIKNILDDMPEFKSKDDLLEEAFAQFVATYQPDSSDIVGVKNFFKAYVTDAEIREIITSKQFVRLATNAKLTLADFKALGKWRTIVPTYIQENVSLTLLTPRPIQYSSLFISYASQDDAIAQQLHRDLRKKDVPCWFAPHDLQPGNYFRECIDRAIHTQDKLLLLLSEHSLKSGWVRYEVELALAGENRQQREILFPIRLDNAIFHCTANWAVSLRETRHIGDFTHWQDDAAYDRAFTTLLRHLKVTQPPTSGSPSS